MALDVITLKHISICSIHKSYGVCFSAIFTKGDNFCDFLFATLDNEAPLKWGLLLEERICS